MSEQPPDPTAIRRQLLGGSPLLAVARGVGWDDLERSSTALLEAGFPVVEVTLDAPEAIEHITRLRSTFGDPLVVGAGTVRRAEDVRRAVDAGAAFIVSPSLDPEVVRAAVESGVPMIPGTMTPTEIEQAMRAGATAVKVFPAGTLGPGYVKAVSGPIPEAPIIVTGGIGVDEVAPWLEAGAVAVGLGSALFGQSMHELTSVLQGLADELKPWTSP